MMDKIRMKLTKFLTDLVHKEVNRNQIRILTMDLELSEIIITMYLATQMVDS